MKPSRNVFLFMLHVDWIHPHSLGQSYSKHTALISNMLYPQSVEFSALTSHVLSCPVPPWLFLHTHKHTYTNCPQDNTACLIPCTWQSLPLFDSFICLFGYQQAPRTQTLCLLYQIARSRKLQTFRVFSVRRVCFNSFGK